MTTRHKALLTILNNYNGMCMFVIVGTNQTGFDSINTQTASPSSTDLLCGKQLPKLVCVLPGFHLEILSRGGKSGDHRNKRGQQQKQSLSNVESCVCMTSNVSSENCHYFDVYGARGTCIL